MRELLDANLFARTHPSWPQVSPGEWPATEGIAWDDADRCISCGHWPGCACTEECISERDLESGGVDR